MKRGHSTTLSDVTRNWNLSVLNETVFPFTMKTPIEVALSSLLTIFDTLLDPTTETVPLLVNSVCFVSAL